MKRYIRSATRPTKSKTYDTSIGKFTITTRSGKVRRRGQWVTSTSTDGTFDEFPRAIWYFVERDGDSRYVTSSQGDDYRDFVDAVGERSYDAALRRIDDEIIRCFQDYYEDASMY